MKPLGVIVLEPDEGMGDIAVLFTHNEGYSTMCGHASLALCRYLIDAKLIPLPYNVVEDSIFNFTLQCPCGPIQCSTKLVLDKLSNEIISDKNHEASYIGVKSFNVALDLNIEFKNDIKFFKNYTNFYLDLSFGGAFYCLLDLTQLDLNLNDIIIKNKRKNFVDNDNNDENFLVDTSALSSSSCDLDTVLEFGKSLLKFLKNQEKITNLLNHENSDLNFLYGLILTDG
ncbi:Trans-L-3-hydroxyproline dehydratase [Lobulomyces angularis]|nr:Trans-L-3-hydroxyproline dehydratase [Lobulomyces angularis]